MKISHIGAAALLAAAAVAPAAASVQAASAQESARRSAIFGGGPFYSGGQAVMDTLRASGFTTVILWTIHVDRNNGDLIYNDVKVVSGGTYVGDPGWPARLRTLKQAPTSVNRIEIGVGSAGVDDWGAIGSLIGAQGTGSGSILSRNFRALKEATGADAINDDDESHYDVNSATQFATMTSGLGYSFAIAPYTNANYWSALKKNLGGVLDRVYLQTYDGGSGNDPGAWGSALGMAVDPGMWSRHGPGCAAGDTPSQVRAKLSGWGSGGGFMWLYDDMLKCPAQGSPKDYASAVNGT